MPILLRHNETLELSRVEYCGVVRAEDLHEHARYNATNPILMGFDCVSVIHADIDLSSLSMAKLDGVFDAHRELFKPLGLMLKHRSAWVCESPVGQGFLTHWLAKRTFDKSPWADVRQFDSFETAGEWMLLGAQNTAILKSGEGFAEIARFEMSASGISR